ncbi:CAPG protein, partial [Podargus strigoides]|nr:CAPG protein [Podargus strigoides]
PHSGSPFGPTATHPGLHVWRVEKLRPVEVPETLWGVFFSGDAYLVLHNGPEERAHLHLWMGEPLGERAGGPGGGGGGGCSALGATTGRDSSRDEQGACALLSTQLNALLGERPVTHREVQGNESDVFMEYFPRGVTYQEGGVDSAFKPTRPGASAGAVRKLYQVKGKKRVRASERALGWASFNTGDCFILDLGQTLFVWCGARSNVLERSRAQELAAAIRDGERGGKARLEIVADGEEPPEMLQVLGPKPALQEGSPEEDAVADQRNAGTAVSDATGRMDLSQVATSSPFSQSLLCSHDCFVLDNGADGKVFVWKGAREGSGGDVGTGGTPSVALTSPSTGHKANEQERQAALKVAEEVIARMGHSPQTQVEILPEGRETPLFKQFFTSWNRNRPAPPQPCATPIPVPSPCQCYSHPCASPNPMPSIPMPTSPSSPSHPCAFAHTIPMPMPSSSPCHLHPHVTPILVPSPSPCHPKPVAMPTISVPMLSPHPHHCCPSATCMPSPPSAPAHTVPPSCPRCATPVPHHPPCPPCAHITPMPMHL